MTSKLGWKTIAIRNKSTHHDVWYTSSAGYLFKDFETPEGRTPEEGAEMCTQQGTYM